MLVLGLVVSKATSRASSSFAVRVGAVLQLGVIRVLSVLQLRLRLACGLSSEKAGIATSNSSPASVVIW